MSLEVLTGLVRDVVRDDRERVRLEGLPDDELLALGLTAEEVASIRDGLFDRVLRIGVSLDGAPTCCT